MRRQWVLPPAPSLPLTVTKIRRVLVDFDGPQVAITTDPQRQLYLAVVADHEQGLTRWLESPLPPHEHDALLIGQQTLADALLKDGVRIVDRTARGEVVSTWVLKESEIPAHLRPRANSYLPGLIASGPGTEVASPRLIIDGEGVHGNEISFSALGHLAVEVQGVLAAIAGEKADAPSKTELRMVLPAKKGSVILPMRPVNAELFEAVAPQLLKLVDPAVARKAPAKVQSALNILLRTLVTNKIDIYPRWQRSGHYISSYMAARHAKAMDDAPAGRVRAPWRKA